MEWSSSNSEHWAPIPIRLIVGYGFMAHGYAKLVRGPEQFVGVLHTLGVPLPELMAWMTIVVELVGGLAVLMGTFVRLMSVPLAAILLVSMFTVELPYGFLSIKLLGVTSTGVQLGKPGYEVDLLYLACLTTLLVGGTGKVSFDRFLSKTLRIDPCRLTWAQVWIKKNSKRADAGNCPASAGRRYDLTWVSLLLWHYKAFSPS